MSRSQQQIRQNANRLQASAGSLVAVVQQSQQQQQQASQQQTEGLKYTQKTLDSTAGIVEASVQSTQSTSQTATQSTPTSQTQVSNNFLVKKRITSRVTKNTP